MKYRNWASLLIGSTAFLAACQTLSGAQFVLLNLLYGRAAKRCYRRLSGAGFAGGTTGPKATSFGGYGFGTFGRP
jgi:hypothetical protein